jgi:hypothetical protein
MPQESLFAKRCQPMGLQNPPAILLHAYALTCVVSVEAV